MDSTNIINRELWEERAAILEYDAGFPREMAERLALLYILPANFDNKGLTVNELIQRLREGHS